MITTIMYKELKTLFSGSTAWVVLALMCFILAWLFAGLIENFVSVQSQLSQSPNSPGFTIFIISPLFGTISIITLMLVPFFGMRLIAEERRNQTLALLISSPISITEIVLGKFLGLMIFLLSIISIPVLMALSLCMGGTLDWGVLFTNIIGTILVVAAFAAITLFVSSLTVQPILAAIGSLGILLAIWIMGAANLKGNAEGFFQTISILKHFENFNKGVIETADFIYLVIFVILFLTLTIRRLDSIRLRG